MWQIEKITNISDEAGAAAATGMCKQISSNLKILGFTQTNVIFSLRVNYVFANINGIQQLCIILELSSKYLPIIANLRNPLHRAQASKLLNQS